MRLLASGYQTVFVRNNSDGTVTIAAAGSGTAVDRLINSLTYLRSNYFVTVRQAKTLAGNDETVAATGGGMVALSDGGGARTGLRIGAGAYDGQVIVIAHVGSNNITLHTTEATARVAGSATIGIITAKQVVFLIWDVTTALWYHARPMT